MQIVEITSAKSSVIDAVADIHLKTFQGFFLTFMGLPLSPVLHQG